MIWCVRSLRWQRLPCLQPYETISAVSLSCPFRSIRCSSSLAISSAPPASLLSICEKSRLGFWLREITEWKFVWYITKSEQLKMSQTAWNTLLRTAKMLESRLEVWLRQAVLFFACPYCITCYLSAQKLIWNSSSYLHDRWKCRSTLL